MFNLSIGNMIKSRFILFIATAFSAVMLSCSSDTEPMPQQKNFSQSTLHYAEATSEGIKPISASSFFEGKEGLELSKADASIKEAFGISCVTPKTRGEIDEIDLTPSGAVVRMKGYKEDQVVYKGKFYLTKDITSEIGIIPGIYYIEIHKIIAKLPCAKGRTVIPFPDYDKLPNYGKHMGVVNQDIISKRGYTSDAPSVTEKDDFEGTTYCMKVLYDMLGRREDKWWPVEPRDLVWVYLVREPIVWESNSEGIS